MDGAWIDGAWMDGAGMDGAGMDGAGMDGAGIWDMVRGVMGTPNSGWLTIPGKRR